MSWWLQLGLLLILLVIVANIFNILLKKIDTHKETNEAIKIDSQTTLTKTRAVHADDLIRLEGAEEKKYKALTEANQSTKDLGAYLVQNKHRLNTKDLPIRHGDDTQST